MYVYTVYVKWSKAGKEKGLKFFQEEWLPWHSEVCDRYEVKLLRWALPMGVAEDHVYFYEAEMDAKRFLDFKGEVSRWEGELLWEYSRTEIAVVP
jgi:hypothetical protein